MAEDEGVKSSFTAGEDGVEGGRHVTRTAQATGRGGRRGLLASLGLGILETLSGTPWTREGGEGVGGASEQDCGVLSSTKVGSVQARTRGATGGRGKDEMGP
eukprot:1140754-Pelagomonas_calceolata.AAC.3